MRDNLCGFAIPGLTRATQERRSDEARGHIPSFAEVKILSRQMKEEKSDEELEEAKELFKDGFKKILQGIGKVTEKVAEGFREGYAKDVTKKEK